MKVIYYSHPCYLDYTLPLIRRLAQRVELHLVLELSPEQSRCNMLDIKIEKLPEGFQNASGLVQAAFPKNLAKFWQNCASIKAAVHKCKRSFHPTAFRTSRRTGRRIASMAPDVVHINDVSLRTAWMFPVIKNLPIALTVHDPRAHSGEKDWRRELARHMTLPHADSVLLLNQKQIPLFSQHYRIPRRRLRFTPIGEYSAYRHWRQPDYMPMPGSILFFGRISKYKGLEFLYRAVEQLCGRIDNIKLTVAGRCTVGYREPEKPALLNGGRIIRLNGYITNEKLCKLFIESQIVVCPYVDATQSGVIMTAYAFEKPVIVTDVGGLTEYVVRNKTGAVVSPEDDRALAMAMEKLLLDKNLYQSMQKEIIRLKSSRYNWEYIAEKTVAVYRGLLQR